jgi:membrane protein
MIKSSIISWKKDNAQKQAATLSFYTILGLPAFLIVMIGISALFIDKTEVLTLIQTYSGSSIGTQSSETLSSLIQNIPDLTSFTITAIISFIFLIITASGILENLQSALNAVWNIQPKKKLGWGKTIKNKLVLFVLIIVFSILITLSILLQTILGDILHLFPTLAITKTILSIAGFMIGIILLISVTALIFKILPSVIIEWKEVIVGSIFTALLLTLGNFIIGFYVQHRSSGTAFGVAGSVITILLWIYYSYSIFLLGAEFTEKYAEATGRKIKPNKSAEADTLFTHIRHAFEKK